MTELLWRVRRDLPGFGELERVDAMMANPPTRDPDLVLLASRPLYWGAPPPPAVGRVPRRPRIAEACCCLLDGETGAVLRPCTGHLLQAEGRFLPPFARAVPDVTPPVRVDAEHPAP